MKSSPSSSFSSLSLPICRNGPRAQAQLVQQGCFTDELFSKYASAFCCSVAQSCPTLCDPMDCSQASLSFTISQSLLKPMSIESVMPSNHLIQYRPLLLLPSIFPGIMVFSNESALRIRWPKYWSFSFNISPSNEYSGLISFRMDWFDLLAVQGTLKGLLQHHSSKASILWRSAFFMVQLSRPYMTTGKTIPLTMEMLRKVIYLSTNIYLLSS